MKISSNPSLPGESIALVNLLRQIANQLNGITEGRIYASHAARTAAPTTGTYALGDFVLNSNPVAQGSGLLAYSVIGWLCTVSGTPGTWIEQRVLSNGGMVFTKLLNATATLDFPDISSNGTEELTITVTGAATGDYVLVSAPAAIESGLLFVAFVSATDTVTVRVHNTTGGSVNPASATWKATVVAFA